MSDTIKRIFLISLLSGAALYSEVAAIACGLQWQAPMYHFDKVDENGNLSYWDKIEDVDFGGNLKIPLLINFNSAPARSSLYLGKGWIFPIFESNIIQLSNNEFLLTLPDGNRQLLRRVRESEMILQGNGWAAKISGETIVVKASCGWSLVFSKGKISSMSTPENRTFNYIYHDGKVSKIVENGSAKITLRYNDKTRELQGINFNQEQMGFEFSRKPLVTNEMGVNMISGMDQSLGKISRRNIPILEFEFSTDPKIRPDLKVKKNNAKDRYFVWDSKSGKIIFDGEYSYNIGDKEALRKFVKIERTGIDGSNESWDYDEIKGLEVIRDNRGVERTTAWFTSGPLFRTIRKIVEKDKQGNVIHDQQFSYNDRGRLIREYKNGEVTTYERMPNHVKATKNSKILWSEVAEDSRKSKLIAINKNHALELQYDKDEVVESIKLLKIGN